MLTAGSLIKGRPWVDGQEAGLQRGIVLGTIGEYLTVWYPGLGELCRDEDGHAVQATMTVKAVPDGHLRNCTPLALKRLHSRVRQAQKTDPSSQGDRMLAAIAAAALARRQETGR